MKNYFIIFIRAFNDLDMVLPFIDYILTKYKDNIILYSTKKNISGAAYQLEYLKTHHHIKPKYFFDEQCFRRYNNILYFRDRISQIQKKRKAKKPIRYISYLIYLMLLMISTAIEYILQKPIKRFVDKLNISDKIMVDAGSEVSFPNRLIVKLAGKRSLKTIGYSHGYFVYSNLQNTGKSVMKRRPTKWKITDAIKGKRYYCTSYVTGRSNKDTYFRSSSMLGFKKLDRVYETCTPRYTKVWIKTFRSHLMSKNQFSFGDKEKTSLVLFLSNLVYNVNKKELINTLHELSKIDNINFVYKPHTRGGLVGIDKNTLNCYDASDVNSILLSDWADVGIVFGSSIGLQLLLDNVPIIVPTYVHENTTIFEKYKICITVDSLRELITILSNNTKYDIMRLIDNRKKEKFLNKFLDGDKSYDQMMQEYYETVVDMKFVQHGLR